MKKKITLLSMASASLLLLAACGRSEVTQHSTNFWEQIVYGFAQVIRFLSFGGMTAVGIILFTLIIRAALLPLMNIQIKSSQKMQEIQRINQLQAEVEERNIQVKTWIRVVKFKKKHKNFTLKTRLTLMQGVYHY